MVLQDDTMIADDKPLSPFDRGLRRLAMYVTREGHAAVPVDHVEADGYRLGNWVRSRRREFLVGSLNPQRIAELEGMPGWVWSTYEASWKRGLLALRAFVGRERHARVFAEHIEPDGFELGAWVKSRRSDHALGRLAPERITELEAVPGWVWNLSEAGWSQGITALRSFVSREAHTCVPQSHLEADGFKLGIWIRTRQAEYHAGRLSAERVAVLETIPGWTWSTREALWHRGMVTLQAYAADNGHGKVPTSYVEAGGFKLGWWVSQQRGNYRQGRLSPEQVVALEGVPGWVWSACAKATQQKSEHNPNYGEQDAR